MYWLIGRNSKLSLENKILLYKIIIIKPIWTYGVEIGGCASKSNISIIQRSQSKILRMIANAPWYVPNITLYEDLNVPLVKAVIKQRITIYHNKIEGHVNVPIQPLLHPHNQRRLKGIGQPTYVKVNEELFLDKPLHVILNKSKLCYRIYAILFANKELLKKLCSSFSLLLVYLPFVQRFCSALSSHTCSVYIFLSVT
jgi:hypothetical protein